MKSEIFIICTTDSMILSFLVPYIKSFEKMGFRVRCVCSRTGDHFDKLEKLGIQLEEMAFTRNPFTISNIKAYIQLRKTIRYSNAKLVFCHEPVGGVMGRLVGKRWNIPVVYMAHGFHFYHKAPLINWMIFYPIEKMMSYLTNVLITINTEDYKLAQKRMKAQKTVFLAGVGVDIKKYDSIQYDREKKRKELGIPKNAFVLISVGELNENKNHTVILDALHESKIKNVYYLIAGVGNQDKKLMEKADAYGIDLRLLGYRRDCAELYAASDVFCFPSYREGLSVALMEAMASGLPVIASKIRGNVDLIDKEGGVLIDPSDIDSFKDALEGMWFNEDIRKKCGVHNKKKVMNYSIEEVLPKFMYEIEHLQMEEK